MDSQTKFWIILTFAVSFIVLVFTLYVGNQDSIIPIRSVKVEVTPVDSVVEEIEIISGISEYISAEEEILRTLEKEAKEGAEIAYRITFIGDWSKVHNPDFYPEGAHFSPFIAWSYYKNIKDFVFTVGDKASNGMEVMSETGNPKPLLKEIKVLVGKDVVHDYKVGSLFHSPGKTSVVLHLSRTYSKVSFVSMLAPTPDWFASVQGINLYDDGWIEDLTIDTEVFDAGTDSGKEFNSEDRDTRPKKNIRILEDGPNIPVARIRFQRIK